eukprot:scaffold22692_cov23-Tisochrysis_lutea.AAC.1
MQAAVTPTPATPKYEAVPSGASEGSRQSGVSVVIASALSTALRSTLSICSASPAARSSTPVSAKTDAQAMPAVEQSRSDAIAGKNDERGPSVFDHAPTYDGWRVAAQASPIRTKP